MGVGCNVLQDTDKFNGQRFETAQDISRYILTSFLHSTVAVRRFERREQLRRQHSWAPHALC